jgi:predicted dehydrogenase
VTTPHVAGDRTTDTLKVGLLSLAHVHAATYAALLRDRPDVEVVVADPDAATAPPDEQRASALAAELGVRLVDSYAELFRWGPDAVVICAETARHRELVELSASRGVPILCEKPLATTAEDARAMLDACHHAGVTLMTAYPVRFHPAFRSARATIRSGKLGRVLSTSGTNNGQAPLASRRWFVDPELAGGGSLIDHTVHLADLLDDLLDARPVEVYAQTNGIVHGGDVSVETGGLVVVTYDDGTVSTIDCSWSAPATYPSWGGLTLTVECEGGSVDFDAFSDRVELYDDELGRLRWLDFGTNLDALMLDAFLAGVRTARPVQPDGEAGYRTLQLVLAAYASAASGQPAPVPGYA